MGPLRDSILRRVTLLGVGLDDGVHLGLHGVLLDHSVVEDDGERLGRRGVRARRPGRVGVDDGVPLLGQAELEHCIRTRLALGSGREEAGYLTTLLYFSEMNASYLAAE